MAIRTRQNEDQNLSEITPHRFKNWPLIAGLVLVLFIVVLAIIGPDIAPKDPSEEINITMIEGTWYVPPFDIGTPGYPLGSDRFGRDLYSRLLWGIRPTMIMVFIVAVVRLFLGVIIGLAAGWFTGKTGRFLDGVIQVALALPVLLVALGAIAIVGVELGIWAFIIGLSLTGWVDTALQVREQTRIVKGQVYIEAASAMGASNRQILSNHILKQIAPMLLMLFAFEISSTLMLTAGLGFLGYYIGGDVWVETDDFVARRISGSPELGQMLATSWITLTKPWAMVAVGTTVFITVLGFNLIGEGLRQNMGIVKVQRKGILRETSTRFGFWIENTIWHPLIQFVRIKPLLWGLSAITIFFLLSFGALIMLDAADQSNVSKAIAMFDQSQTASADETQSPATEQSPSPVPNEEPLKTISYEPQVSWQLFDEGGFSGGPVLSKDKSQIYVASGSGKVYALDLAGNVAWQLDLAAGAVGTPAIDIGGDLYVADQSGGLNRITPQGELVWNFQTEAGDRSHSGPSIGPAGTIYYTVGTAAKGIVQSVKLDGEGLWATEAATPFFFIPPVPSADGKYVFLKDDLFLAENGELVEFEFELDVNRYFTGENGQNYLLAGQKVIQWEAAGNQINIIDIYEWDNSSFSEIVSPVEVGVLEDGDSWQLYTSPGGSTRVVWVSEDDQVLGTSSVRISNGLMIDMQSDLSALVCGGGPFEPLSTDCALVNPSTQEPLWKHHLGDFGPVSDGFKVNDLYYLSTEDGYMLELDENYEEILAASTDTNTPSPLGSQREIGIQWTYHASDHVSFISPNGPEGTIYLTTEDDKLHILGPGGEVVNVIQLPIPLFHQVNQTGRDAPIFIEPIVLPDGTILIASDEQSIYAVNSNGDLLWQQDLESEPAEYPVQDPFGTVYLIDNEAAVNAFDRDGLKWRFASPPADIPAHGLATGPEGNLYYVVTNYSKGFIQALSPDGDSLWVTEATTVDFYDELHVSSDGKYISLAENLISTESGEIVEYDNDNQVDEFIFAPNGMNYMRSLHTVNRWQSGPSGVERVSSGTVSEEDSTLRPPLWTSADANGIVWLFYPERYTGGGIIVVWMSPDGQLLGNYLYDRGRDSLLSTNLDQSHLIDCRWFSETESMDCSVFSPFTPEPVGSITIENIASFAGGFIEGYTLYVFSEENELSVIYLGQPAQS